MLKPINQTSELVELIKKATPPSYRYTKTQHFATSTFRALRMFVNNELEVLREVLKDSIDLLNKKGRLVVISFHSLEDKIVKDFFKNQASCCICPPGQPICTCNKKPTLKILTKKPVLPTNKEISKNIRARSAKLRAGERI